MLHYCYICNMPMTRTLYVCNEHDGDPETGELYSYVLAGKHCDAIRLGPRLSPNAPIGNLQARLIDADLIVDIGL